MTFTRRALAAVLPYLVLLAAACAVAGLGLSAAGRHQVGVPLTLAGMFAAFGSAAGWRYRGPRGRHRVSAGQGGA